MEALKTALFENPTSIYIFLAIIAIPGLVYYRIHRTPRSMIPTGAAVLVGVIVFGISALVVTDREQILAAWEHFTEVINSPELKDVEQFLDDDFRGPPQAPSKPKIASELARRIKRHHITYIGCKMIELDIHDDRATMLIRSEISSEKFPPLPFRWALTWVKRPEGWLILRIEGPIEPPVLISGSEPGSNDPALAACRTYR